MTQDEIIEMAKEAGAAVGRPAPDAPEIVFTQCLDIYRFAKLVAQHERETCIDIVAMFGGSIEIEAAIRAREQL